MTISVPDAPMLTGETARELHVSPDTVRHLERAGILTAVKTAGGVRLFDPEQVARLKRERAAKRAATTTTRTKDAA
jgi:DNA-binding transcriptional MerR regulator